MTKKEYNAELEKHGPKELVRNFVFPVKLSAKQKRDANAELNEMLRRRRATMSEEDNLKATLLQLRYRIEDYLKDPGFDKNKTFGFFLKQYISSLNKKRNEFAQEINIKPAELSQYINNHRNPPQNVIIRLELHSHKNIPATSWYSLLQKETLHELESNGALRTKQRKHVLKRASLV